MSKQQTDETTEVEEMEPIGSTDETGMGPRGLTEEAETETPADEAEEESTEEAEEDETFSREYVENLRDESAKYRTKAKDRDDLAARLHTSLVAATGRLADPSDLTFDDAHLGDADTLTAALDELLARKPHLATRKPSGDIGQGATGTTDTVDLAGMLRSRAS